MSREGRKERSKMAQEAKGKKGTRERWLWLRALTDQGETEFWSNHIHEIDDACLNTPRTLASDEVYRPEREELRAK